MSSSVNYSRDLPVARLSVAVAEAHGWIGPAEISTIWNGTEGVLTVHRSDADPAIVQKVADELPILTTDRSTIPADGTTAAVVTYNAPAATGSVTFDVNGATATEQLVDGTAAIEVTATAAGPITVACEGLTATIQAEEV
jgi:hypothetical protein